MMLALRSLGARAAVAAFVIGSLTLTACGNGSDDKGCTLLGCTNTATFVGYATLAHDDMEAAKIMACRQGGCSAGTPTSLPNLPGDTINVPLSGQISAQATIFSPDGKGYKIEIDYTIDDQTSKDGDAYELKVLKADGTVVNDYQANAIYKEVSPNGPGCPPVCKQTTIDKSNG